MRPSPPSRSTSAGTEDVRARKLLDDVHQRLRVAEQQARDLEAELHALERRVALLERGLTAIDPSKEVSPLASVRVGLAAPLALLATAMLFDVGLWPLGLAAGALLLVQVFLVPLLSWRAR